VPVAFDARRCRRQRRNLHVSPNEGLEVNRFVLPAACQTRDSSGSAELCPGAELGWNDADQQQERETVVNVHSAGAFYLELRGPFSPFKQQTSAWLGQEWYSMYPPQEVPAAWRAIAPMSATMRRILRAPCVTCCVPRTSHTRMLDASSVAAAAQVAAFEM
jgi:hypothetical protein